jgi:benzil reductase ((S)-benzoin forming)
MNYFFITGTSRGIGKSLANTLLLEENNYVIGFSRTNSVEHERFEHREFDFRDIESVWNYKFNELVDANSITLINNSGLLGNVKHVGGIDGQSISDVFNVNVISPFLLINSFICAYQNSVVKKVIINISSGAARRAIESWSSYCASKSALDMLTEVVFMEQAQFSNQKSIKILSIAPGIVDTQMQDEIRKTDRKDFNLLDTFMKYKEDNLLASTEETAKKLIRIINQSDSILQPIIDMHELEI